MKFTYPSGSRPLEGYTIKRGVGRGGFGEVYFATSDAGKEVALKLIRRNLEVELRGVKQCLNLKHANLISLFDIRADSTDNQWVIMEYVSGESLDEVIDQHPNGMPIEKVLSWMHGLCAGVVYLHDHGIVHRDLKPGNIFSDDGVVKIGDYGLAKFISCSQRSGQTDSVGTVHYMAPEIANGRYGREIDTYALGIILYEMLTGSVPFEGESVGEVLMKHLTASPDLNRIEEPYRDIVRRALEKDPAERIQSVGEMLALLDGEEGKPILLPVERNTPVSSVEPAPLADEEAPIQEPLFQAIHERWTDIREDLFSVDFPPISRALLLCALVLLGSMTIGLWLPLLITGTICYILYYAIWLLLIRPTSPHALGVVASATAVPPPTSSHSHRQPWQNRQWREITHRQLAAKPFRKKLTELLGSMLLAAFIALIAALIAPLLLGTNSSLTVHASLYLWLAMAGTLGSWAILIPTKFSEGRIEDQAPMRIVQLILGTLVGVAIWWLGEALLLNVPTGSDPVEINSSLLTDELLDWNRPEGGSNPSLLIYVTYFASLFLLLRWWRLALFTRRVRISLWTVTVCLFWAWLLHMFWWFPQPLGMMVAGVIAVATQLASPWLPPSRRKMLSEER